MRRVMLWEGFGVLVWREVSSRYSTIRLVQWWSLIIRVEIDEEDVPFFCEVKAPLTFLEQWLSGHLNRLLDWRYKSADYIAENSMLIVELRLRLYAPLCMIVGLRQEWVARYVPEPKKTAIVHTWADDRGVLEGCLLLGRIVNNRKNTRRVINAIAVTVDIVGKKSTV